MGKSCTFAPFQPLTEILTCGRLPSIDILHSVIVMSAVQWNGQDSA